MCHDFQNLGYLFLLYHDHQRWFNMTEYAFSMLCWGALLLFIDYLLMHLILSTFSLSSMRQSWGGILPTPSHTLWWVSVYCILIMHIVMHDLSAEAGRFIHTPTLQILLLTNTKKTSSSPPKCQALVRKLWLDWAWTLNFGLGLLSIQSKRVL